MCDVKYIIKKYADVYVSEIMTEKMQKYSKNNDKKAETSQLKKSKNDKKAQTKKEQNNQSHFAQSNFI